MYAPLRHAEWHGWTPTDLIFPFFLFIIGVAMTFSLEPRLRDPAGRPRVIKAVALRAAIIIALGLFMSAYPRFDINTMRFPGVLQRIGLVYFCASMLLVYLKPRMQIAATGALLLGYWLLMAVVPTAAYGAGDLTAEGNLGAVLDRMVFGTHLWQDTWDPEGLLSTLPAIATTLTGVFAGRALQSNRDRSDIAASLFVYGWAAILAGIIWHQFFPINKNLWTSSYVVFSTGAALQFLAACFWLIDVRGYVRWAGPAIVFGRNSIAVFVLSGLVAETMIVVRVPGEGGSMSIYSWVYQTLFVPWAGPMNGSLAFALATISFWFGAMWLLYRRNIFIKV